MGLDEKLKMAQGPAKKIDPRDPGDTESQEEFAKEDTGYTYPNLHRRVDPKDRESPEYKPRDYMLGVYGLDSFRTTTKNTHDEESTDSEIP